MHTAIGEPILSNMLQGHGPQTVLHPRLLLSGLRFRAPQLAAVQISGDALNG